MARSDSPALVIGLVNNMPPGAYHGMEAQFAGLIREAAALTGVGRRTALFRNPRGHARGV